MDWVNNVGYRIDVTAPGVFSTDYELEGRYTVAVNNRDCGRHGNFVAQILDEVIDRAEP
jgi:hypothetical protein